MTSAPRRGYDPPKSTSMKMEDFIEMHRKAQIRKNVQNTINTDGSKFHAEGMILDRKYTDAYEKLLAASGGNELLIRRCASAHRDIMNDIYNLVEIPRRYWENAVEYTLIRILSKHLDDMPANRSTWVGKDAVLNHLMGELSAAHYALVKLHTDYWPGISAIRIE